jgi:hypothetical protein
MPTLEPSVALATCEAALRQLMAFTYRQEWGDQWLERISTETQRDIWAERATAEAETHTQGCGCGAERWSSIRQLL